MSGVKVRIDGYDKLIRKFTDAPEKLKSQTVAIMNQTINDIQSQAKRDVKVKTGKLQNSITHRAFNFRTGGFVSAGNKNVRYAPYVEFGTGNLVQISLYPGIKMDDLGEYAMRFKRSGLKKVNLPHRPFLFSAFADNYQIMMDKLKAIKL